MNIDRMPQLPARILMALLFLSSGYGKLAHNAATQAYMHEYGVRGILAWPAAAWELTAGILLVAGLWMRPLSVLLAGWCLLTAAIFHTAFADQNQMINFLKNMTMAGGFLFVAQMGSDYLSIDGWRLRQRVQR